MAVVVVALVVAVLLLVPPPPNQSIPTAANEFDFPDVSNGRAVPILIGTARLAPNIMWYGDISSDGIWVTA